MVSTLTAGATAYFYWNSNFSDRYHVTPEIEKKLNDSNSDKEMNQFTEHDGIRIEAVLEYRKECTFQTVYPSEECRLRSSIDMQGLKKL